MATTHCLRRLSTLTNTLARSSPLRTPAHHLLRRTLLTTPTLRSTTRPAAPLGDQFPTIPSDSPPPPPKTTTTSTTAPPDPQDADADADAFPDRLQRPKSVPLLPKRQLILSILALMGMTGIGIVTYLISNTVPAPNTITTSSTPEKERKEYKYLPNPHKAEASTTSTAPPLPTTQLPEGIPLRYTITDSFTAAAEAKARESKTKNEDDDKCKEKVDSVKGTYVLLGHGIRTVSFLSIKVYDAGMYIHEEDLPLLKKYIATLPTTTETTTTTTTTTNPLTPLLTSPTAASEKTLDALLNTGIRTLFLIHPARNTDWAHLRDGWIRGIKARKFTADQDEELGDAVAAFREMFVRTRGKSVEKGGTILLVREGGAEGGLQVWFDGSTAGSARLRAKKEEERRRKEGEVGEKEKEEGEKDGVEFVGRVGRPIVARALWGGYLAGPRVSSEELRGRVVEGLGKGGEVSV